MQGHYSRGKRGTSTSHGVAQTEKEGDSRAGCAVAVQEDTVVPGNGSIGHRHEDSEGDGATETTRTVSEGSPPMGRRQGRRGRCASCRPTSRMALCRPTKSAAARCDPGAK